MGRLTSLRGNKRTLKRAAGGEKARQFTGFCSGASSSFPTHLWSAGHRRPLGLMSPPGPDAPGPRAPVHPLPALLVPAPFGCACQAWAGGPLPPESPGIGDGPDSFPQARIPRRRLPPPRDPHTSRLRSLSSPSTWRLQDPAKVSAGESIRERQLQPPTPTPTPAWPPSRSRLCDGTRGEGSALWPPTKLVRRPQLSDPARAPPWSALPVTPPLLAPPSQDTHTPARVCLQPDTCVRSISVPHGSSSTARFPLKRPPVHQEVSPWPTHSQRTGISPSRQTHTLCPLGPEPRPLQHRSLSGLCPQVTEVSVAPERPPPLSGAPRAAAPAPAGALSPLPSLRRSCGVFWFTRLMNFAHHIRCLYLHRKSVISCGAFC